MNSFNDFSLPKKTVSKIIKSALPEGVQVSQEVKTAVGRTATIFILSVTSTAQSIFRTELLTEEMIIQTIDLIGFSEFVQPLKQFSKDLRKRRPKRRRNRKCVENNEINETVAKQESDSKSDL